MSVKVEPENVSAVRYLDWPIFISYRRGKLTEEVSDWLLESLQGQVIRTRTGQSARLNVYLDRQRVVQKDFDNELVSYLEQSRALVFLLDPLASVRKTDEVNGAQQDFLYRELLWWKENRGSEAVPLILETDRTAGDAFVKQDEFVDWVKVSRQPCYWEEWKSRGSDEFHLKKVALIDWLLQQIRDYGVIVELEERRKLRRRLRVAQMAAVLAIVAALFAIYYLRDSSIQASRFNGARHDAETILTNLDKKVFVDRTGMGNVKMLEPLTRSAVDYFRNLPGEVRDSESQRALVGALLNQASVSISQGNFADAHSLMKEAREQIQLQESNASSGGTLLQRFVHSVKAIFQQITRRDASSQVLDAKERDVLQRQQLRVVILEAQSLIDEGKKGEAVMLLRTTCSSIANLTDVQISHEGENLRQLQALCFYILAGSEALAGDFNEAARYRAFAARLDPNAIQDSTIFVLNPDLKLLEQAGAAAQLMLSDPAKAADIISQGLGATRSANWLAQVEQLEILGALQDRAGQSSAAAETSKTAENLINAQIATEPNNPDLHAELVDVLLSRLTLSKNPRPLAAKVEDLKNIETYVADHCLSLPAPRLKKLNYAILRDWADLANWNQDIPLREQVREKLLSVLTQENGIPVEALHSDSDRWVIAELRTSLATIFDSFGQQTEALKYLDLDQPMWEEFFLQPARQSSAVANLESYGRLLEAKRYARARAFLLIQKAPNDSLLWFKRAAAALEEAGRGKVDSSTQYSLRREQVELLTYVSDLYLAKGDYKQARDTCLHGFSVVQSGVGEDLAGLVITAKLHITFASADMLLSKARTKAGLQSIVAANKIVDQLKAKFWTQGPAQDVISRFVNVVDALKQEPD